MAPASFSLRPRASADRAFLRELYLDSRRAEFAALPWPPADVERLLEMQFEAQTRQYAAQYPEALDAIVLVSGEPAGRLYVARRDESIQLIDIALSPAHRGRGIGAALIGGLQGEAGARGVPVRLAVLLSNPAGRLYRRLGFQELGVDGMHRRMEWRASAA
jgi:ribosomal protein S18 acetylase RimI-like enzyme